jgi:hypothetical protein
LKKLSQEQQIDAGKSKSSARRIREPNCLDIQERFKLCFTQSEAGSHQRNQQGERSRLTDRDTAQRQADMPGERRQGDMKKILVLIVAAAFIFSVTSFCLAAYEFYRGTITQISGDKVTVQDDKGRFRIINKSSACGGCGGMDLKIGDKVSVENGKIIKMYKDGEDGVNRTRQGSGGTEISPDLNPQPEPPMRQAPRVTIPDHK